MNQQIQSYLEQVMRGSALSKREKAEWIEEMSAHLTDEIASLMHSGYEENEATRIALQKFGEPSKLRKKISHDTFGLSVSTILWLAAVCFALFCIDYYILQLHGGKSWYERFPNASEYVLNILSTLPLSPSLMLGLCFSLLALFKTRRRADREGIGLTLAIFGVLWVLIRLPLPVYANELLFGFKGLTTMQPWISIIDGVLVVWGLMIYVWTQNLWIGLFPTILSIVVGLWSPILYIGHPSPQEFVTVTSQRLLFRCIPIVLLVLAFKAVDTYSIYRKSSTVS